MMICLISTLLRAKEAAAAQRDGCYTTMDVELPEFRKCALDPRNKLCHMKASLNRSSISFSVQSLVGRACRNIMISYESLTDVRIRAPQLEST